MSAFDSVVKKISSIVGITTKGQATAANSFPVTLDTLQDEYLMNSSTSLTTIDESTADLSANFGTPIEAAATADGQQSAMSRFRGLIKWAYERMPASLGQKAMTASLPVVIASDQSGLPVSRSAAEITPITISGATVNADSVAYAVGETIGSKLTLSGVVTSGKGASTLRTVIVRIAGAVTWGDFTILLFNADPSTSTFTNHSNMAISSADASKVIGKISCVEADFASLAGLDEKRFAVYMPDMDFVIPSGTSAYAAILSEGALDLLMTQTLSLEFVVEKKS